MAAVKIDATLISAKMHVIIHVYTNLWCFQEQFIKKYMFIIVFFRFPVKLLINFSSTFGNMHSKYGGNYRRKAKFLLFHNSLISVYMVTRKVCLLYNCLKIKYTETVLFLFCLQNLDF